MKATLKAIAALTAFAFATPAFAGGVTAAENGDSKLKFSAKFYINGTSSKTTGGGTVATNGTTQSDNIGMALDRAYLTVSYQFDNVWSMGITTDTNIDTALAGKKTNVYIKKAYARGKFSKAVVLDMGVIGTPWIGYEEGLHKHRYVFKSFVDQYGFDSSADAGIGLKGKLADGLVQYAIAEVNGGGYGNISKTKSLDFNSRVGIYPVEGVTIDFQFRDGYKGTKSWNTATQTTRRGTKHTLFQGMVTYGQGNNFRVGGNYINEKSDRQADAALAITQQTTKTDGYDAWAWVNVGSNVGIFGRYEHMKQKRNGATVNAKTDRYVGGIEYFPRKNVTLAVAADQSKTKNANFNTGATVKNTKFGLYSEIKF